MTEYSAQVATNHASRYLQQLCKHWSHKFDVSFDAQQGLVPQPMGAVNLNADAETLSVRLSPQDGADVARMQAVVAEHINRFAFREGELVFDWQRVA